MIEEWDSQRDIKRATLYSDFYLERKKEFLSAISYFLSTEVRKSYFLTEDVKEAYRRVHADFNLPASACTKVIAEVESHSGLIVRSGVSNYQFSHKSIQEFLCAKYLMGLGDLPTRKILDMLPNELAILIALASKPSTYLEKIWNAIGHSNLDFFSVFVHRIADEKPDFDDSILNLALMLKIVERATSQELGANESIEATVIKRIVGKTNITVSWYHFINEYQEKPIDEDYIQLQSRKLRHLLPAGKHPKSIVLTKIFWSQFKEAALAKQHSLTQ